MNNASTSTRDPSICRGPRSHGVAMVMVMIALVVGTIITLSFLSSQTTSMAIAHNANRQVQARAVAEDGMRLAIEHLRANVDWRDSYTHGVWTATADLNGGSFRVMFEDDDDSDLGDDVSEPFVLTVEASFNGVVHRVSNRIVPSGVSSTMTVMLVTGNAYHADEDLLRIAMIESWGYTVVTVTDSDSQAVYDAAAARADVIYISEESDSGSVGSKCNGYDIGVVNEEQAMQDDLKMSTSGGTYLGNAIDITDNTHPITAGFSTDVVVITDNSTGLIYASGTPAADLTTLAERDGSSSKVLTVLDVGDTMTDGNPSPQRRVTLPFGSNSFEFGHLNAAGQKLMKQAIVWAAAGRSDAEPGLSAEWVTFSGSLANGSVDSLSWDDPVLVSIESQVNFPNTSSSSFSADGAVDRFGVRLAGTITIPDDGLWGFRLGSDDGSKLWVDDDLVVDHDGLHSFSTQDGSVNLTSGPHDFEVQFFEQGGSQGLIAYWREPGSSSWEVIPESAFTTSGLPEAEAPNMVALYEFIEPEPVTPQLVSHWKLNETSAASTFIEVDGEVVIEAENFTSLNPGSGSGASKSWNTTTAYSPSGGLALIASPNTGVNLGLSTNGPRLDYEITFTTPGTYRVWVRMIGPSGNDDSVHVGFEGVCLTNAMGVGLSRTSSSWGWEDDVSGGLSNVSLVIPIAGTYTFNVWMREDGTLIDKIVLNTDAAQPSGAGPSESETGGTAADEMEVSDGSYQGAPSAGQSGFGDGGTSVRFNGSNQFVAAPHAPAYLLDNGTVSFWFRANDLNGIQGLIAKDAAGFGGGGHFAVALWGSTLVAGMQDTNNTRLIYSPGGSVTANTWNHVAFGFGAGGMRLYLNGQPVASDDYAGGLGSTSGGSGNNEPFAFGASLSSSSSGSTTGWSEPFNGRLDDVRIYDQNLNEDQAGDLHAKTDPRPAAPPIVEDTSGNSPALDLTIADPGNVTWISGGGLTIDSATSISSGGPVTRLQTAIAETDRFTLEAVFSPANITQDGAARIVTYANGTSNRNFQLGQIDATYDVRLRTESIPSGGPEPTSDDVFVADQTEHVLVTYNGEELRVYRNGTLEISEEWTGDLDNWNSGYELLMGNEASGNRPWLGTLRRVAIYDGAINKVQADNLFNGDPPGDGTGGDEGFAYQVEWLESP